MKLKWVILAGTACAMLCLTIGPAAHAQQGRSAVPARIYNTAKQKLMEGKPIYGGMVLLPDPETYCAMANAGFDYLWIEMQHSPMTYEDVAKMIWACRGAPAMPFIRVPDATESDIQKATDIGAVGIIVPTVDTVEKAEAAVKWSRYPPYGRRSSGNGQYAALWGRDYRQTINDNMFVTIMIETPIGVANADKIAAVPGLDAIFIGNSDLASFSGYAEGSANYEAMVKTIHDATLRAGKKLGGTEAFVRGKDRKDFLFSLGASETGLIRMGAQAVMGIAPAGGRRGGPADGN